MNFLESVGLMILIYILAVSLMGVDQSKRRTDMELAAYERCARDTPPPDYCVALLTQATKEPKP